MSTYEGEHTIFGLFYVGKVHCRKNNAYDVLHCENIESTTIFIKYSKHNIL
jgi:hypothetical protein